MGQVANLLITENNSIREAIARIDSGGQGIVLVVDEQRRLVSTVVDGDIRRAILANLDLDAPVGELLKHRPSAHTRPVTALMGTDSATLIRLMHERAVRQIPLLDSEGRVVDVVTMEDVLPDHELPVQAVIMAGGFGNRLRPLTEDIPKPMLPVGDRPLMEFTIDQLRESGIKRVNITTHYKPEKITAHFGDGSAFGVDVNYVQEDSPLGTAGALALLNAPAEPLLVINGDILTRINFRAMLRYHRELGADLTVGVRIYEYQVPYGVVQCEGAQIRALQEKPRVSCLVSAGIYLLEPSVHRFIATGERLDMTDLIQRLVEAGGRVISFPIHEYWADIGQHVDYEKAQSDYKNGRLGA